nr:hypothetical protein GCM10020093_071630 [Planobispora longispora]
MPVDLRLMRYVVTIAEEGGFQRAAERLHMAQPPLSRQIRDLERQLGVALFHRRPTRLTEAGKAFVASARRMLADADAMIELMRAVRQGESGTVRLGMVISAAHETVPELLAALRSAHPDVTVRAREAWSGELDAGLRAGRFDLVLGRMIPRRPGLARQTVRREPLVAVVGTAHPLAAARRPPCPTCTAAGSAWSPVTWRRTTAARSSPPWRLLAWSSRRTTARCSAGATSVSPTARASRWYRVRSAPCPRPTAWFSRSPTTCPPPTWSWSGGGTPCPGRCRLRPRRGGDGA